MRGAREIFCEYILEPRGRTDSQVGRDAECALQQESIVSEHPIVLVEAGSVSCL